MDPLYTAEAISTGSGRNGHVRTSEGTVDLDMAAPKELGGSGKGANPEQLFAAGYAACFHSALLSAARTAKVTIEHSSVGARVTIGKIGTDAVGLAVELEVVLPDTDPELAQRLTDTAHTLCPYSNATRGNIDVQITVSDD